MPYREDFVTNFVDYKLSNVLFYTNFACFSGQIPLIGVGGIENGEDAFERIQNGASLIQLYTALVFQGPSLIGEIKTDLAKLLT